MRITFNGETGQLGKVGQLRVEGELLIIHNILGGTDYEAKLEFSSHNNAVKCMHIFLNALNENPDLEMFDFDEIRSI